jgi:hypothetical protein
MWLERAGTSLLGPAAVARIKQRLLTLRDAAVREWGLHPVVLDMPDGLLLPEVAGGGAATGSRLGGGSSGSGSGGSQWLHAAAARGARRAQRMWHAVGGDKVDADSLVLTCLLGALAAVLWMRQRRLGALPHALLAAQQQRLGGAGNAGRAGAWRAGQATRGQSGAADSHGGAVQAPEAAAGEGQGAAEAGTRQPDPAVPEPPTRAAAGGDAGAAAVAVAVAAAGMDTAGSSAAGSPGMRQRRQLTPTSA